MAAAAWGSPLEVPGATPVDVDFGFRGIISEDAVKIDDKCYVSMEFLRKVEWNPDIQGSSVAIHDDGRIFTLPLFSIGGKRLVCLNDAAKELQAKAYYPQNSDCFCFKAAVSEVSPTASGVIIRTSMKVRPMITLASDRLTIDLKGAEYDSQLGAHLPLGWKMALTTTDTERISIEHPALQSYSTPRLGESRTIKVALPDAVVASALKGAYAAPRISQSRGSGYERPIEKLPDFTVESTYKPLVTKPVTRPPIDGGILIGGGGGDNTDHGLPPPSLGAILSEVSVSNDDSERLSLNVFAQNLTPGSVSVNYKSPTQIMMVFNGAQWKRAGDLDKYTNLARAITKTTVGGFAALSIVTEVPLVFSVSTMSDNVSIRLTRPRSGGLSRKVVVIDPGHGGHDNGCTFGGLMEKNMTLAYSLIVAQRLQREGASVILTRSDDSYPSLTRRWQIANESYADAFISIHINSLNSNAPSASMTFFHGTSNISNLLAECLQSEVSSASTISSWGTVNDFKRFREGMAVLKTNHSPSVLMELGFINNTHDRAEMLAPDFGDRIADAITRGLKKFFGERH